MMKESVVPLLLLLMELTSVSGASIMVLPTSAGSSYPAATTVPSQQDLMSNSMESEPRPSPIATENGSRSSSQQLLVQSINPIEIGVNGSMISSSSSNHYQWNQNSRLRVAVSNVCEKSHMKVTVRLNKPFYGLIHARDQRKKVPCFLEGSGAQSYTIDMSFTLKPTDAAYCGMVAHQLSSGWKMPATNQSTAPGGHYQHQQETLSLALVVRLHKTIEFSDDRYFLLSCPNRCSRSDCSSSDSSSSSLSSAHEKRGFVASDSNLSPTFRSISQQREQAIQTPLNNQRQPPGDQCDLMADLKFQWLVKLCWILIGLIALMFCAIFYLCIAPDPSSSSRRAAGQSRPQIESGKDKRRSDKRRLTGVGKSHTGDQAATYPAKSASSAVTSESSVATDLGWSSCSTSDHQQQQVEKMRENNHHLANKQHLLITNFLAAKTAIEDFEEQQPRSIFGRSRDTLGMRQFTQIPRRRSIGGSMAMLGPLQGATNTLPSPELAHQQRSDQMILGRRLDHGHKSKSKSQTTIYYEQGQDPFKANPFQMDTQSGYRAEPLGDHHTGNSHSQVETFPVQPRTYSFTEAIQQQSDSTSGFVHSPQIDTPWHTLEPQSIPMSLVSNGHVDAGADLFAPNGFRNSTVNLQQHQQWHQRGAEEKSMVGGNEHQSGQQDRQNGLGLSQFDPQTQSRQLIDMIQQKHRQQMAQAARTAASMKSNHTLTNR